jgi:ribosomal protein S12 methylthiotransferase accessory factor
LQHPNLSQRLLLDAATLRCGLLQAPQSIAPQACDLPGIANVAIASDPINAWQTTSGAVGYRLADATAAAIGEGLERYAAANTRFPLRRRATVDAIHLVDEDHFALFASQQYAAKDFPFPLRRSGDDLFAGVYSLKDNSLYWVPQELVGLGPREGEARLPSTSSGLAAHRDASNHSTSGGPWLAVLRATQELLERDALTVTWLNGLGGREIARDIALNTQRRRAVMNRGGEVHVFDLTQAWNPHRVIAVAGSIPSEGAPRYCFGIACRATFAEAFDKAWLEWAQALVFAGHMRRERSDQLPREPKALRQFDEHAAFYTLRPELWHRTAFIANRYPHSAPLDSLTNESPPLQLEALWRTLDRVGIDLFYRELTTVDVMQAGLRVMRVISPQLSALHADERAPFLGGRCNDVEWRYPGAKRHTAFCNPLPHPLG